MTEGQPKTKELVRDIRNELKALERRAVIAGRPDVATLIGAAAMEAGDLLNRIAAREPR